MQRRHSSHLLLLLLAALACLSAAEPGDPAFLPSPERPVGWRGTGDSHYPAATPPLAFGPEQGIAWRTDLGSWSWSTPVVIGELVVTLAEPHEVIGVSLGDGTISWRRTIDQFALLDPGAADSGRALLAEEQAAEAAAATWAEAVGALLADLKAAGHDDWARGKAVSQAFAGGKGDAAGTPPDPALAARWQELATLGSEQGFVYERDRGELAWTEAVSARRQRLASEFAVHWESHDRGWHTVTGESMASPVSDGSHIFVALANNVVTCLDLVGEPVWQRFDPKPREGRKPADRCRRQLHFVPSPVLSGDLVIVAQDADRLRAYRKSDGEKVWEVAYPVGKNTCGTPTSIQIGGVTAVVAANGRIHRSTDGSVLVDGLPVCDGGCSPLVVDDVLYVSSSDKKAPQKGLSAYRLSSDGDTLSAKLLWNRPDAGQNDRAPVLAKGLLFTSVQQGQKKRVVACLDPASGETVTVSTVEATGNPVFTVAGDKLIVKSNAESFWIFNADRELQALGAPKLDKAKGFGYPTFNGSLMLVRHGDHLVAIDGQ